MGAQQPPGLHARRVPRLAAGQLAVCGRTTRLVRRCCSMTKHWDSAAPWMLRLSLRARCTES